MGKSEHNTPRAFRLRPAGCEVFRVPYSVHFAAGTFCQRRANTWGMAVRVPHPPPRSPHPRRWGTAARFASSIFVIADAPWARPASLRALTAPRASWSWRRSARRPRAYVRAGGYTPCHLPFLKIDCGFDRTLQIFAGSADLRGASMRATSWSCAVVVWLRGNPIRRSRRQVGRAGRPLTRSPSTSPATARATSARRACRWPRSPTATPSSWVGGPVTPSPRQT